MKDERPCDKCIFHDGTCHHWDCKPITRSEAELAVDTLRELAKTITEKLVFGDEICPKCHDEK